MSTPENPEAKDPKQEDKEIEMKAELENALDYMCQQLEQLAVLDVLPNDIQQREFVIDRALDVRSSFMLYLATIICHESTPLGIPGIGFLFCV